MLFDQKLSRKITFFIFGKPSRNILQEIDFRLETGGGFKYDFIDNYSTDKDKLNTDLSFSAAMVYEFTNRLDTTREEIARLSLRPKFKQQLSENLEFSFILFWQPDVADFDDYRIIVDTGLSFKVSKSIAFILRFTSEYNSVVPEGVRNSDYRLINQLSISI